MATGHGEDEDTEEALWKIEKESLLAAIKVAVQNTVFSHQQFVTCKEEAQFGSDWQQVVYQTACPTVPLDKFRRVWEEDGEYQSIRSLNRKRDNARDSMHKAFAGKCSHR